MSEFKGTKGEWTLPHFANNEAECNCKYILNPMYEGCIATVEYGEYNPPLEEAKANALLISKAPEMLEMLNNILEDYDYARQNWEKLEQLIKEATEL